MVPAGPVIADIVFVFILHIHCVSIVSSLYFRIFSASFILFLSSSFSFIIIIIIIIVCAASCIVWRFFVYQCCICVFNIAILNIR